MTSQEQVCIEGIKDALRSQEKLVERVLNELHHFRSVSVSATIDLERSKRTLRDAFLMAQQIEESVKD